MITPSQPPLRTVGFWVRVIAYVVDGLLLSLVGGAFPLVVLSSNQTAQNQGSTGGGGTAIVSFIYFVIFWSHLGGGRTIGMRLLGLKVIGADGREIGILTAIGRWIGLWISFLVCFLGVIWVAIDSQHQGWHDKLVNTYVVHA